MLDNYLKVEKKVNILSKFQNNTKDNLLKKMKECIYSQIDLPNATKDNLLNGLSWLYTLSYHLPHQLVI